MPNGRCRFHGGKSTGPRSPEGLARCRRAGWKHGARSAEMAALRAEARASLRRLDTLIAAAKSAPSSGDNDPAGPACGPKPEGRRPAVHGVPRRFFSPLAGDRPACEPCHSSVPLAPPASRTRTCGRG
ncbi:MAG: HGGxSTG domain-containing protein [Dongiaceae bacterium]